MLGPIRDNMLHGACMPVCDVSRWTYRDRNKELLRKSNKRDVFYHISNHWEECTTCSRVRTLYFCVGNVWKRFKTNKLAKLYANKNQMSILVMRIPLFQLENLLMRLRRTQKLLFWCLWLLTGKLLYKLKKKYSPHNVRCRMLKTELVIYSTNGTMGQITNQHSIVL